jgi:hypothetical protein
VKPNRLSGPITLELTVIQDQRDRFSHSRLSRLISQKRKQWNVIAVSISKYSYLLPGSLGNMHSIRNSCAVMDSGVPTVVTSEK